MKTYNAEVTVFEAGENIPEWVCGFEGLPAEAKAKFGCRVAVFHLDGVVQVADAGPGPCVIDFRGAPSGSKVAIVGAPTKWPFKTEDVPDGSVIEPYKHIVN